MKFTIPCPDCKGTGICATTQMGRPPSEPHSCCGDCDRRLVPSDAVPAGFFGARDGERVIIGTGILHVGFWPWLRWRIGMRRND
jgi:hypothetical protein